MARSGFSTANYLNLGAAIVSGPPFTLACWAIVAALGGFGELVGFNLSTSTGNDDDAKMALNGSGNVLAQTANHSGTTASAASTTAATANEWFHACVTYTSVASRAAYLNGAGKGTNTTSISPNAPNQTFIGGEFDTRGIGNPFSGSIAEAAIWNIVLSDTDVASLAAGASPLLVHPEALVSYWPLIGNNSPENNIVSASKAMPITGSPSAAAHPRILLPHRDFSYHG